MRMTRLVQSRPLVSFYVLALAIAVGVMAVSVPWMLRDAAVAGMMPALFQYLQDHPVPGSLGVGPNHELFRDDMLSFHDRLQRA